MSPPDGHRLIRASAGTGKTYQLVEAYLGQVLQLGRHPREVVAITFTRKAAEELRGRIRAKLREAGWPPGRLAELDEAPIGNFHTLAMQLLSGAGLGGAGDAAENVLGDDGEDRLLFISSCERAWFGQSEELAGSAAVAVQYLGDPDQVAEHLWDALGYVREQAIPIVSESLLPEFSPDQVRLELQTRLLELRERLRSSSRVLTGKSVEKVEAFLCEPIPPARESFQHWVGAWQRMGRHLDRRGKLGEFFHEEDQELFAGGLAAVKAEERCAILRPHMVRLIDAAWSLYRQEKASRHAVDFADLIELLVASLSGDLEFHRGVRERYRAVLVDEAQDTNALQRRMVRLLTGLEGPAAQEFEPATLFLVGDRKQAIYTFRGADAQSFDHFAQDVRSRGGTEETLQQSYRATPALVRAINHLGAHLFAERYESLSSGSPETVSRPAFSWLQVGDEPASSLRATLAEAEAVSSLLAQRLRDGDKPGDFALLMRAMTKAPLYVAALAARGVPCILGGGGALYEQAEVVDLLHLLGWLIHPQDALAAAIALRSPLIGLSDSALLFVCGRGPGGIRPTTALATGEKPPLSGLDESDAEILAWLAPILRVLSRASATVGAADLLELADALLDIRAVLSAMNASEQRLTSFARLIELAHAYDRAVSRHATGFVLNQLDRLERGHRTQLTATPASERRAVTIASVHSAKGLEYPVVCLADLNHGLPIDSRRLLYSSELGLAIKPRQGSVSFETSRWRQARASAQKDAAFELANLLYVAVTRAQHEVLFFSAPTQREQKGSFLQLLAPWQPTAVADGVMAETDGLIEPLPVAEPETSVVTLADREQALSLWQQAENRHAPAGTRFWLPVTTFDTYVQCSRRGYFLHELNLSEPSPFGHNLGVEDTLADPPIDPLTRGRLAHAVLAGLDRLPAAAGSSAFIVSEIRRAGYDPGDERLADVRDDVAAFLASPLGHTIAALSPADRRVELPFFSDVDADPYRATLTGQIDLLYWDAQGPIIVDYKHAHGSEPLLASYGLQLDTYALAVAQLLKLEGEVRTRLVFLRDRHQPHERLVTPKMRAELKEQVRTVVQELAMPRPAPLDWPGQPKERCIELGCGFVERCHAVDGPSPAC